jgi:hypothetical protein
MTAEGTTSKGTGNISCEYELFIFLQTQSQNFTDKGRILSTPKYSSLQEYNETTEHIRYEIDLRITCIQTDFSKYCKSLSYYH